MSETKRIDDNFEKLMTNVGDKMCRRQLWDVDDGVVGFCHQHPFLKTWASGTKAQNCHQQFVTNMVNYQFQTNIVLTLRKFNDENLTIKSLKRTNLLEKLKQLNKPS